MTVAAEGASDEIDVCFVVRNAVGWPLAKINATALRTDVSGPGATVHMTTGADGLVRLTLVRSAWRFTLLDELEPTSPARNGLVYLPTFPGQAGAIVPSGATLLPGSGGTVPDACGPGRAGYPLMGGVVVMNAPSTQGYLEATVLDAAVVGITPLAGARIATSPAFHPDNTTGAKTGTDGKARIACVAGASNQLISTKNAYLTNSTTSPCSATAQTNLTVNLWRTPLSIEYTILNETFLATTHTGLHEAGGASLASLSPKSPVTTARATVTRVPATINASMCTTIATGGTIDIRPPPLTSASNVPPYVCSTPPDSRGRATLLLPWAEGAAGDHEVTIAAAGYAPTVRAESVLATDVLQTDPGTGTGIRRAEVTLVRATVELRTIVRDVHNATLSDATVHVNSTDPLGSKGAVVSGADGSANFTLPTGPYTIAITHDAKERRTCTATLVIGAGGAGALEAVTPRYCFQMVATGKSSVNAVAIDDKTSKPIPDLQVCHGSVCDVTSADGSFELELAPGTSLTTPEIQPSRLPKQAWWAFASGSFSGSSPALGLITESGEKNLNRTRVPTTIFVRNAAGDGLPLADVEVHRGAVRIHHADPSGNTNPWQNVTDATGKYHIDHAREVSWSKHVSNATFDIDPYVAKARKHRDANMNATLYDLNASAAFHLLSSLTPHEEPITLDEKTGTFSAAVVAWDPHSQKHIDGLLVRAVAGGSVARDRPALGPVNLVATPGTFTLYNEFGASAYKTCSNGNARYEAHTDTHTRCAAAASGVFNVSPIRTSVTVNVRGIDPHTNFTLANYNITFTGQNGFSCEPFADPSLVCGPKAAGSAGQTVEMKVPWTDAPDQLCAIGTVRSYNINDGSQDSLRENAAFLGARHCPAFALGPATPLDLRPLRAPAPALLNGTVKFATGGPAVGAYVNVTSDRASFVCEPVQHHSNVSFPDCRGVRANATGEFSILVPNRGTNALLADGTWKVNATLPGYYNESYNRWPAMGLPATLTTTATFTLYPREFDAIVTVLEQAPISTEPLTQHTCDSIPTYDVRVRLHDLEAPGGNPMNVPAHYRVVAPAQPDGSCLAVIRVKDWHRDPPTLPVQAQMSWPKTTFSVLLSTDHIQHVGWTAANLGPADADRRATILMVHADGSSGGGSHTLGGRIFDADVRPEVRGATGVPARITATPTDPSCAAGGVTTYADLDGNYSLPLPCGGNYTIVATPLVPSHWEARSISIDVVKENEWRDLGIARKATVLTVTVMRATSPMNPAPGTQVDPTPLDTSTDPAPRLTDGAGIARFGIVDRMTWGLYSLPTAGRPAGTATYVSPTTSAATVYS